MPRIYLKAKEKVEDCTALSISSFSKSGALKSSNSGTLSWSDYWGNESSIAYTINVDKFTPDFEKNKEVVSKMISTQSKKLRNIIAGYVTRLVKKETQGTSRSEVLTSG